MRRLIPILALTPALALARATWTATVNDTTGRYASLAPTLALHAQTAGRIWSDHVVSPFDATVSIRIDILDVPSNRGSGGSATASFVRTSDDNFRIFEQGAAALLRAGHDQNGPDAPDVVIEIDPDYIDGTLWFTPDPLGRSVRAPDNRVDDMSFFLHELGHAIALNGWRDWSTAQLPPGADYQSTFDQFVTTDPDGVSYFTGPRAVALYGAPVPLTKDNLFHLGNNAPTPGDDLLPDLMNGVVFYFGNTYRISPLDLAILADTGLEIPSASNALPGDANADGAIDARDLALLLEGYANNLPAWSYGDFNSDGRISPDDFAIFNAAFATASSAASTPIPEPTAALSVIGLAPLMRRRCNRPHRWSAHRR